MTGSTLTSLETRRDGDTLDGAPIVWVLTDGKIGDDVQCLAVAAALTKSFDKKVIAPRAPWSWLAPWGPIDPRDSRNSPESPIAGKPPNVVIASGRRTIPYARAIKAASDGQTLVVILKDPRAGRKMADFIWVPAHDRLRGDNVYSTLTSPHHITRELGSAQCNPAIADLPRPLLGVVLGGPSGGARYGTAEAAELAANLQNAAKDFASLAITPSRRTPKTFLQSLRRGLSQKNLFFWDGTGANPYLDILSSADTLIVAADSHNMMSEAMATGTGIYAYRPPGLAAKMGWFVNELEKSGAVRGFDGEIQPFNFAAVDATQDIVAEIKKRLRLAAS